MSVGDGGRIEGKEGREKEEEEELSFEGRRSRWREGETYSLSEQRLDDRSGDGGAEEGHG